MPEGVTYRVNSYYKLAKGEIGITSASSLRLDAAEALGWIFSDMPDEAYEVTHSDEEEGDFHKVTIVIDWTKVPDSIRAPKMPTRNGRRI